MAMRVSVGLSRKLGQPDYGSLGASCNLDMELDGGLLQQDPQGLHRHIRGAFALCTQAVADELARQQAVGGDPAPESGQGDSRPPAGAGANRGNGHRGSGNGHNNGDGSRAAGGPPMTASQRRAIFAIARRLGLDPADEARHEFGLELARMTVAEASRLIDHLKSRAEPAGQDGGGR